MEDVCAYTQLVMLQRAHPFEDNFYPCMNSAVFEAACFQALLSAVQLLTL